MEAGIQLDLFHGVVLSKNQLLEIDNLIKKNNNFADSLKKSHDNTVMVLEEAGYVRGVDFSANYEIKEVTESRCFGYSYDNSEWEHECTYNRVIGDVYLLINKVENDEIVIHEVSLSKEEGKFMCSCITDQWRYYLPTSLLKKLKEFNQRVVWDLETKKKKDIAIDSIVVKYRTLYPKATVKRGSDYWKGKNRYNDFPIVRVTFCSGSYVEFKLNYEYEEIFHKKHDAQKESANDCLIRFSKQVKK